MKLDCHRGFYEGGKAYCSCICGRDFNSSIEVPALNILLYKRDIINHVKNREEIALAVAAGLAIKKEGMPVTDTLAPPAATAVTESASLSSTFWFRGSLCPPCYPLRKRLSTSQAP